LRKFCLSFLLAVTLAAPAWSDQEFDVVVYGATPGGLGAAITAARMGHSVALVEPQNHVGGMTASGLSRSDVETRAAIGGLYREFVGKVYRHYVDTYGAGSENLKLSEDGYACEPHVAEKILSGMISAEPRIRLFTGHLLEEVSRSGRRVVSMRVKQLSTGKSEIFRGRVFIDASYEGDLAAAAGAAYRIGRESRAEFNEVHAGVIYLNPRTKSILAGTTGAGDRRVQAYTFRLCLTVDPANSYIPKDPPPGYRRELYLPYLDDVKAGRMGDPRPGRPGAGTVVRAFTLSPIPNQKYDANSYALALAYPFSEESEKYPEAGPEQRRQITDKIRNLTIGLLWFMQHDPDVPAEHREIANKFNLAKDEFPDNNHFPWQLYVREARRIIGLYTLSENDVMPLSTEGRPPIHADAICAGEYPIDSMPMRKRQPGDSVILEGYLGMMRDVTRPYQIPFRIIVPRDVDGLLVPVAASTTHLGFSSIRLEPTWTAIGQAAGLAAHLAIQGNVLPGKVDIDSLQRMLLERGQVLTYFKDMDLADPAFHAIQYWGTKGFFKDYYARTADPLEYAQAVEWLKLGLPELKLPPQQDGPVRRSTVQALLGPETAWADPKNDNKGPDKPVRRGEFCRAMYVRASGRQAQK
jgi:FAD dependent oxidoreductase